MTTAEQSVLDDALSLPVEGRVALVQKLLGSLNPPPDKEVEEWWAAEAERRISQIERGEVELVSAEDVFRRLRERYPR